MRDECNETHEVDDAATLICRLARDHDGPHYDDVDDVTWKVGKPDE